MPHAIRIHAELPVRPVSRLVKLPDAVSDEAVAAMMLNEGRRTTHSTVLLP